MNSRSMGSSSTEAWTNDLERRKSEHRTRWPDGKITKIGRRTTRAGALEWLREQEAKNDLPVAS